MTREIRFRAWNKTEKEMIYDCYSIRANGYFEFDLNYNTHLYDKFIKPEFVMQYTGLHDRNGKEIYEGDILDNGYDVTGNKSYLVVEFYAGNFCCGFTKKTRLGTAEKHSIQGGIDGNDCGYIIGNIWENPELLETK